MDKFIGKRLDGRYEIKELVGMGGMANVYKAYDVLENKHVAIKILKDEFLENEEFLRRFRNESKAIAALSHPNIVKILDVNFGDRIQYIVMEHIDGITLKEYIEQIKVIKWKDAVHFTVQILRGLQHAHDKGIVHRDIKPQNIMLLKDGTIKVMDFGIACFARDERKIPNNKAIGSVHYISPEQAKGDFTDEKSDVYSVGVMIYEMLTGKLPFDGESPEQVAVMQMQASARMPRQVNSSIPEGLEEIIIRAMQKEPNLRYQSAAEMLRDIDDFKRNPSIVFEYKYFPQDDGNTRYFDAVNSSKNKEKNKGEAVNARKIPTIPILTGIALAFVVIAAAIVAYLLMRGDTVKEITITPLVGLNYYEIKDDPKYSDYKWKLFSRPDDEYEEGVIIQQNPNPGQTVKSTREVEITLSEGPQKFRIREVCAEEVINANADRIANLLKDKGFNVEKVSSYNESVAKDNIISTTPAPDEEFIKKNTTIIITYSLGPDDYPTSVPSVLGETKETAIAKLLESSLAEPKVVYENSYEEKDVVISQSENPGTIISRDSQITITLSNGNPPVNKLDLKVQIPTTATGAFIFNIYKDGSLYGNSNYLQVGAISGQSKTFSVEGNDKTPVTFSILIYPEGGDSGDAKLLAKFEVDFRAGTVVPIMDQDNSAFKAKVTSPSQSSAKPSSTPASSKIPSSTPASSKPVSSEAPVDEESDTTNPD